MHNLLPLLAAGLSGLDSFYSGAIQKPAEYFNMSQINKARKLNQCAKAHRRGCPTAGNSSVQSGVFYSGSKPYINPKTQEKKALRHKLNLSGKSLRRFEKKIERLQCLDTIITLDRE
jgi:hypothetical protein